MTEEALQAAAAAPDAVADAPQADAPQTNDAPAETPSEPVSRLTALEKAFKATDPEAKPEDQASEADQGQPRGPDGKFVAKEGQSATETPQEGQDKPQGDQPEAKDRTQDKGPISEPPARFSADAKQAWKDAPESVRGEIRRAITELESGIQQKDAALEPLKPFMKMAEDSGTTVHEALQRYVNMEQLLRQNPVQGLNAIAQNMGTTLGDLIQHVTGQPQEVQAQQKDHQILQLQNELADLRNQLGEVSSTYQHDRLSSVEAEVAKFASDPAHQRFDELAEEIGRQIQAGFGLDEAYKRAEMLNPLPQVQQPQAAPTPPAQTREVKSVTGSPTAGSNPATRKPSQTREEALQRAMAQTGLL